MNTDQFLIRKAVRADLEKIFDLYRLVSKTIGGLARTENEITKDYVKRFVEKSLVNGVQFVILDELDNDKIIAEIHCYKLEPSVFGHILSELTIAVHPEYQRKGIGKKLFETILDHIIRSRNDVFRVELVARESNEKAIKLYETIGFQREGRFVNRLRNDEHNFEADIPMAWFNPNFKS